MKIAIIGSGISGLITAYLLDQKHDVMLYEAENYVGGHAHTVPVIDGDATLWIDTGYIVCNPKNYPNFMHLLKLLDVPLQKSSMSFSVRSLADGLEYNGTSLNGLFAQRSNIFNAKFWRMLKDIVTFNKGAKQYIQSGNNELLLKDLLDRLDISQYCINNYIAPMIAAIWSSDQTAALNMPALFICKFLDNHGLLSINDRPQWYTIEGGSKNYVAAIVDKLKRKPIINNPVTKILRNKTGVVIQSNNGIDNFDKVVIATHSDQALKLLASPTDAEYNLLSRMRYQDNEVVLHTDISLLPNNPRAWASWNYIVANELNACCVTYNMNMLQNLNSKRIYCVSLNQTKQIDPAKIIDKYIYSHPVYDQNLIRNQELHSTISGIDNTYYCGAYWGNGFHEDGVNSGLKVVDQIDKDILCKVQFTKDW